MGKNSYQYFSSSIPLKGIAMHRKDTYELHLVFLAPREKLIKTRLTFQVLLLLFYFFSIWVFFHKDSQFTGQQGEGEAISLTPLYHFHLLHRPLNITWAITADSSPLQIASSRTTTANFWFTNESH